MKQTTVLIVDGGGRGSGLVAKLSQSPQVQKIIAVPGNDFMKFNSTKPVITFPALTTTSVKEILALCQKYKVSLVDVAQDAAVAVGLVDVLEEKGFCVVGPTQNAGELEWNKAWARDFCKKYSLPQPMYHVFHSQEEGIAFLKSQKNTKWFVKAAGLCEGKGAFPAENTTQAIQHILALKQFGTSGEIYVLEEWLQEKDGTSGEEFSAFVLSDGVDFQMIGSAQDHKRVGNFDTGENTGGMGCVSKPRVITREIQKQIDKIAATTIRAMHNEGRPYKGILYIGGMVINGKVYIVEYNARWGDPEAQVLVPGITTDFFTLGMAIAKGNLAKVHVTSDTKVRVSVVAAAKGYPASYKDVKGKKIFGIPEALRIPGIHIFGAGIKKLGTHYVVNGGRILHVTGEGKNVMDAREIAYQAMSRLFVEGNALQYRIDIGYRDVERLVQKL